MGLAWQLLDCSDLALRLEQQQSGSVESLSSSYSASSHSSTMSSCHELTKTLICYCC